MPKVQAMLAILLAALTGCNENKSEPGEITVDRVENAEGLQAAHSFDFLLNCWAEQWPDGVKPAENAPPEAMATQADIEVAIAATRENCRHEIWGREAQIRVDLARDGLVPPALDQESAARVEGGIARPVPRVLDAALALLAHHTRPLFQTTRPTTSSSSTSTWIGG